MEQTTLNNFFKYINPVFSSGKEADKGCVYAQAVFNCLEKVLPSEFLELNDEDEDSFEDAKDAFRSILPVVKTIPSEVKSENISFMMLCKYRPNAFKFFFEMMSRWLVPGKRLDVLMIYAADFRCQWFGQEVYTICEIMITVDDPADLPEIQCNLPIIEMEARLGVESAYHARRILEIKGLTADEKTAMIQEYVAYFVRRSPKRFDRDLFTEMQHVLVICPDHFKHARESKHLSRVIAAHYIFRKDLLEAVKEGPDKRHLRLRLFRSSIRSGGVIKPVLSVLVGLNFLTDKEIFEEQHLLTAIQNYLPSVKPVKGSFFANRRGTEHICTVYLEIEKLEPELFSACEIKLLRQELIVDLKDRIGHLMHPVFMPRNEEEIMRNVLTLSSQIKYIRDLPQVFISFDEQTHAHLVFNVILVRVAIPGSMTIQEIFQRTPTSLEYVHDRIKMLGMLRKKHTKEATVFRVKIYNRSFLRQDHSIDLYKARQHVVNELTRVISEFRDYNGGMISKQNELLCSLRELLISKSIKYNELLLENFFYSLTPVIMRTVMEPEVLKKLFLMMIEASDRGIFSDKPYSLDISHDCKFVYVMITGKDPHLKEELSRVLSKLPRQAAGLANSYVQVHDVPCIGYIYRCDDPHGQEVFQRTVTMTLNDYELNKKA